MTRNLLQANETTPAYSSPHKRKQSSRCSTWHWQRQCRRNCTSVTFPRRHQPTYTTEHTNLYWVATPHPPYRSDLEPSNLSFFVSPTNWGTTLCTLDLLNHVPILTWVEVLLLGINNSEVPSFLRIELGTFAPSSQGRRNFLSVHSE